MAYENIDVGSLKKALNSCKSSLNYKISNNLEKNTMNDAIWYSDSRINLNKAINEITSYYRELEDKINKYLEIADKIKRYKELEEENRSLRSEYASLEPKLYYEAEERVDEHWSESRQEYVGEYETVTKKDTEVESRMNAISAKISENEVEMARLDSEIKNGL